MQIPCLFPWFLGEIRLLEHAITAVHPYMRVILESTFNACIQIYTKETNKGPLSSMKDQKAASQVFFSRIGLRLFNF
jgi:hypothetical protein